MLLCGATGIAALCAFHFEKPHSDFVAFRDAGHALLRGDWAEALIRAPVFPLLLVLFSKLIQPLYGGVWPVDQAAAAILNACLLPVNALLCYRVARPCLGPAAVWPAALFTILPVGLHMTGHTLVEPLLTTMVLGTLAAWRIDARLGYACAALACLTRYDAAGLLVGCALADWIGGTRLRAVVVRSALAGLPLALWLVLLALHWPTLREEHYITQMQQRPGFELAATLTTFTRAVWPVERLRAPLWAAQVRTAVEMLVPLLLWSAAGLGAASWLRARFIPAILAAVALAAYTAVHAAFPFQFERFGYPFAPILLIGAAGGARCAHAWAAARRSHLTGTMLLVAGSAAIAPLFWAEAAALLQRYCRPVASVGLSYAISGMMSAVALVWLVRQPTLMRAFLLLAAMWLGCVAARVGPAMIGRGDEMASVVQAYRWAAARAAADAKVLSVAPGLAHLYSPDSTRSEFIAFKSIDGDDWSEIAPQLAVLHVRWIVWYDNIIAEHGEGYTRAFGLRRFEHLPHAPQVRIAAEFGPRPQAWVLELVPQ